MAQHDQNYLDKCKEVNQLTSTMSEFMDFLEEELGIIEARRIRTKFNDKVDEQIKLENTTKQP